MNLTQVNITEIENIGYQTVIKIEYLLAAFLIHCRYQKFTIAVFAESIAQ